MLAHVFNQLHALDAIVVLARRVAPVVPELTPDARLGAVLVRAGDVAGVRADFGGF